MDDLARTGDPGIGADREIGVDHAQGAVGGEADAAPVEARADGEDVVMPGQSRVVGHLDRTPPGGGVGPGPVDRAIGDAFARLRLAGDQPRTGDRQARGRQHLEVARRRLDLVGEAIVIDAERAKQGIGRIGAAALEVAIVAVEVVLVEYPEVAQRLQRPVPA